MKKILLGTTGLVAVALLATAASAETPKVTLGGFSDFQSSWTSDDKDAGERTNGFRNDNEITVKVDGKTNGGLGYGAEIDLEADSTNDADNQGTNASRTFTYLEGNWGRVELGGNKSVASTMRVDASSIAAATGGINGAWTYSVFNTPANGTRFISTSKLPGEHGNTTLFGDESTYNATKVSYYTPKFSGFQAGVSYTPQIDDRGQTMTRSDTLSTDNIDLGLGYEGTFGGVKLAAAGTYEFGNGNGAAGPSGFGSDDTNAWNLGAVVGVWGFDFAGSYGNWADSGIATVDGDYWTAGLGYTMGPIGLSATYLTSTLTTGAADNDFSNIVLGADYMLAAGLTPYAEVSFYDFEAAGVSADDNSGTTFILGTQVAF
ncbi:MAG: porin [Rickettsiales bacterium]